MDKRDYNISRIMLLILNILVANIVFINDDISMKLIGMIMFGVTELVCTLINRKICEKVINKGDTYSKWYTKVGFYISMLLLTCICILITWLIIAMVIANLDITKLGAGMIIALVGILIPVYFLNAYIHILLILFIRRVRKQGDSNE